MQPKQCSRSTLILPRLALKLSLFQGDLFPAQHLGKGCRWWWRAGRSVGGAWRAAPGQRRIPPQTRRCRGEDQGAD